MRYIYFFILLFGFSLNGENSLLRVGMELSYPPFEMVNPEGQPAGISVDIANALGSFLDREVIIENISFIGLIPALKSHKVDLIISSMTITPERKRAFDFSDPYLETGLCLLINAEATINSIADVNNETCTIVVKSGTSGEVYAATNLKKANVLVLDKESACVLEVVQGKASAFIYDQLSVYTHWQRHPHTTKALLTPFQKEYWGIGMRKGDDALLEKVNSFIKKFREEGGFEALGNKYLHTQKEAFKQMGIPFVF